MSGVVADPDDEDVDDDESSKADDAAEIGVAAACCLSEASENLVCNTLTDGNVQVK